MEIYTNNAEFQSRSAVPRWRTVSSAVFPKDYQIVIVMKCIFYLEVWKSAKLSLHVLRGPSPPPHRQLV